MACDTIVEIRAREAYNARGFPAVAAEVTTSRGIRVEAFAPSGVSVSSHEAVEVRDGGARLGGRGVLAAVDNIAREIAPALVGREVCCQAELDALLIALDGTELKSRLGGNALTAVSLALAKAGAASSGMEVYQYLGGVQAESVPVLCLNLLSGSKTAGNDLDFEDYLLVPFGFPTLAAAMSAGVEIFHRLHAALQGAFGLIPQITALAPPLDSSEAALAFLVRAIAEAGYEGRVGIGIDVAADNFYDPETRLYGLRAGPLDTAGMVRMYAELCANYPVMFLEDPLVEDDFEGFAEVTRAVPCLVVGDDLFASNPVRLRRGAAIGAGNAMLLKVNQAGTVSEALRAGNAARDAGYTLVSSLRSGETADDVQADVAFAAGAQLMKVGAPLRGESVAKYNRALWIERELGGAARFRGPELERLLRR